MKNRFKLLAFGAMLIALVALTFTLSALAQDDDDGLTDDAINAAVQSLFDATATAQADYEATRAAQEPLPATATIQAAFDAAVQATQEAASMDVLYGAMAFNPPADFDDFQTHTTEDGDPAIGSPDAQVTIVEYSDFSCGYCRRFFDETLPLLLDEYGDQIRFVYRDFPVLGEGSVTAAIAAECADEQGHFWAYHNLLFANPGSFDPMSLTAMAYQLELDLPQFEACFSTDAMIAELQEDFNAAQELGATGTPSFTINGEFIVGAQPYEVFVEAIENALAVAGGEPLPTATPDEVQPAIIPVEELPQWDAPPEMNIDTDKTYTATFLTERGAFVVELFADAAPQTVNNFVFLAREGFYDNTPFHRVIDQFMAQGGDPSGTGRGGPGYQFEDETDNDLSFDRPGLLAMANAGPNTNGSQFFITFVPTPHLDGAHTIFGEVIEGFDVVESLARRDPMSNPDFPGDTLLTVEIDEE